MRHPYPTPSKPRQPDKLEVFASQKFKIEKSFVRVEGETDSQNVSISLIGAQMAPWVLPRPTAASLALAVQRLLDKLDEAEGREVKLR